MADRAITLLDGGTVVILLEDRGELRVGACRGDQTASLRIAPVEGSALGSLYRSGKPVALDRPRGEDAVWLHELGLQARSALAEPLQMEGLGGGLVVAVRSDGRFGRHDPESLHAFARSLAERLAAERSVEIERVRHGIQARERERTRWAREIHDEAIQGMGALRMKLASARDLDDPEALKDSV
jgi:signal transduction histidine kinase